MRLLLMSRLTALLALGLVLSAVATSCRPRAVTSFAPIEFRIIEDASTLRNNGAQLANLLVCTDSLGRPMSADEGSTCVPCVPLSSLSNAVEASRHARRLWRQTAKAPYDETDPSAHCTRLSYEFALLADSSNRDVRIDHALFQLAAANDSVRALGLSTIDRLLDSSMRNADSSGAAAVLDKVGTFMWERAQRMYVRSSIVDQDDREKRVHDLTSGAPLLRRLPPLPRTSDRLGKSEAYWSSHLFRSAASLTRETGLRARRTRLSLAPFVLMGEWSTLDSSAKSVLAASPRDSVAFLAHALATYEMGKRSLANFPRIEATFDSALSMMPSSDSLSFDNFDDVFGAKDDEWRYGFLPGVRQQLDRRAWIIVDPLWLTPVNELKLTRRTRKADADFRYVDLALTGQSGSETEPGILLVKAGRPTDQWTTRFAGPNYALQYGWSEYLYQANVWKNDDAWRVFYGDVMSAAHIVRSEIQSTSRCATTASTLVECARERSATWSDAVFYARLDTIDVTLARFRASQDSVDLYIGSRLPLRGFRHRGSPTAQLVDSIDYGFWVSTALGSVLHHRAVKRALPREGEIAWTNQWVSRVSDGNIMHRVEAVDRRHARGARGAALLTSADAAVFRLNGFGMSDILAADKVTPNKPLLQSWRDLEIVANGGVIAPRVPVALAWEVYDLKPDAEGRVQWSVRLRREDGTLQSRFDVQSLIIGAPNAGTQVIASEPNASGLAYVRTEPARRTVVEFLRFNLADAPPGRHVLVVEIEDMVAKTKTSRSVSLRILQPSAQNRSIPSVAPAEMSGFRLLEAEPSRFRPPGSR